MREEPFADLYLIKVAFIEFSFFEYSLDIPNKNGIYFPNAMSSKENFFLYFSIINRKNESYSNLSKNLAKNDLKIISTYLLDRYINI